VKNYGRARKATGDNMAHELCLLDNQDYLFTLVIYTYCISMAIMVTRTRLNITFIRTTDGQSDIHMGKLIVGLRNFANAYEN
jgi:hypothetical protein